MTVASVSFDARSTAGNTQLGFVVPTHSDGSTAALSVTIAGDVTPVSGLPSGWVEENAAYDAGSGATFVTWTNDAALDASVTSVVVQWTGSARAGGTLAVSSNSQGIGQVGAVTASSTANSQGDAASVTAADDDEFPLLFGGTIDVPASSERFPDLADVSLAELTALTYTSAEASLVDGWVLRGPAGISAGATGAVTYGMAGVGSAAASTAVLPRVGFGTFGTGDADEAAASVSVPFPGAPTVGDVAVIGATGQPPDVDPSDPSSGPFADQFYSGGVAVTSLDVDIPAGHVGQYAVVELSYEGSPGTITPPAGFSFLGSGGGRVSAYGSRVTEDGATLAWSTVTARLLQAQLFIVDGDFVGAQISSSLDPTNPTSYGPHTGGQQTGASTSLHLLSYTAVTTAETLDSTDDSHTIVNNTVPGSHSLRTGYATDVPGVVADNPSGTATWSAPVDQTTISYLFDPRPVNPTNLATPAGTTSTAAWTVVHAQVGIGDTPSSYVWIKVLDADDITDGSVVVYPTGATGELGGAIGIYDGVDVDDPVDAVAVTSGAAYSDTSASAALATVTDNACEVVFVFGTDHGAPSHADSTVTAITMTLTNEQAELVDPAGSVVAMYDEDRVTSGAGTARTGTLVNGLASEVNHATVAFALKPESQTGSRQVSQLVTFQPAPNAGPSLSWPVPAGSTVSDPQTFSGAASDADGVDDVDLTIRRLVDGWYWDGAVWQVGAASVAATLGTPGGTSTTWSYTATGAFTVPGSYSVLVVAADGATSPATRSRTKTFALEGVTASQAVRVASIPSAPSIQVEIVGRYGGVAAGAIVARLPILSTSGFFSRVVDGTGEAEVTARYSPLDHRRCADELSQIESWAHELRILWDGHEAFVGPIQLVRHLVDGVTIKAADLTEWWKVRVLGEHDHTDVEIATVFADYHRDAYLQGEWGLEVVVQPVGQLVTRIVKAEDGMVAWTALSELARTGIDYTTVGRTLLIGGEEVPSRSVVTLSDENFSSSLEPVDDGTYRATDFVVSGGEQISGRSTLQEDSDTRRRYGLITGRSQERKILDEGSAARAAQTRLDFGQNPLFIEAPQGAVLRPGSPIDVVDLIPGIRIDLLAASTARVVHGSFRLSEVRCNMNGTVAVTFQPLGSVSGALS